MKGKPMKTLLGTMLFVLAAMAQAQGLEADLDGNASALQASEMPPQAMRPAKQAQAAPRPKSDRQRVAAR